MWISSRSVKMGMLVPLLWAFYILVFFFFRKGDIYIYIYLYIYYVKEIYMVLLIGTSFASFTRNEQISHHVIFLLRFRCLSINQRVYNKKLSNDLMMKPKSFNKRQRNKKKHISWKFEVRIIWINKILINIDFIIKKIVFHACTLNFH